MKKTCTLSILVLALFLTGCPKDNAVNKENQTNATQCPACVDQTAAAKPAPEKAKPPVEPANEDAKAAVELVKKLSGKTELTPEGLVKSITLDSSSLDEAAFDLFAKQEALESLLIANYRELNDSMVEKLVNLKNLQNIQFSNSSISDAAIKTIVSAFPNLKGLTISSNTNLTDDSLQEIANLKELERLVMNYCNFSEFGMMYISGMPKVKVLDIRANMQVGNSGLDFISQLPSLQEIKHRSPAVDDSGLQELTKAKGLKTLEIQDFNISNNSGKFIRQFEELENLIIFRCQSFGSEGLLELKGMNLKRLTLRDLPSVDDAGMEAFRELPTLKRLYLNELNSVSDSGIVNLVLLKDLEILDIWEVPITDAAFETLNQLTNLKVLSLRSTKITDACVDHLLKMPKLQQLTLKDNSSITDAARTKLIESKKFRKLDFGQQSK